MASRRLMPVEKITCQDDMKSYTNFVAIADNEAEAIPHT